MKRYQRYIATALALGLVGCGTTSVDRSTLKQLANSSSFSQVSGTKPVGEPGATVPPANALADDKFLDLLEAEMKRCEEKASSLGLDSERAKSMNLGIAALGIVAGSIVVPSLAASGAAKSAIAAWGGVSGAANAAQLSLNSNGRSPEAMVQVQKQFTDNVKNVMIRLKTLQPGQDSAAFIYELRFACSIGVPIADGGQGENNRKP